MVGKKFQTQVIARLERIENYLQGRFNWDNIPSPNKKKSIKEKLRERSTSDNASNISQKPEKRYNYVVDMSEKP